MTLRIQCWSGPRNVSTALMYSFNQRTDTTVIDEPLYAHYLSRDDRGHPGAAAVLASQSTDASSVIEEVILGPCPTPVLFIKQMAHHLAGLDRGFLARTRNILLTRNPRDMLRSLAVHLPECGLLDTGLVEQVELLDAIVAQGGTPVVIDSAALLADPAGVLSQTCRSLGLAFDEAMLSWEAGPKVEDGVWASHWYSAVNRSTGFEPQRKSDLPMPPRLLPILDEAEPLYDRLCQFAVAAT